MATMVEVLTRQKLSWLLAAFYFLTFGGFVAFSIYLPTLLKDDFRLTPADAGFRTAGFVVLATLLRPLGGWLADRIGGARVLSAVFAGIAPFALLMAWHSMLPFTVGALGCAACSVSATEPSSNSSPNISPDRPAPSPVLQRLTLNGLKQKL
jgi:nitrate/nitrite transporter NarK